MSKSVVESLFFFFVRVDVVLVLRCRSAALWWSSRGWRVVAEKKSPVRFFLPPRDGLNEFKVS